MGDKWIVVATGPDGTWDVTQAESQKEAKEFVAYAKENYPTVKVEIRRSQTGLAIFEGLMGELMK